MEITLKQTISQYTWLDLHNPYKAGSYKAALWAKGANEAFIAVSESETLTLKGQTE